MKTVALSLLLCAFVLVSDPVSRFNSVRKGTQPPDVVLLAKEARLGSVTFRHLDHITKERGLNGKQIACVECHHTAQPVAEVLKHPPHKTAWPSDRTSTLTAELLEKDPTAPAVDICTDCHARSEAKPKLLPDIPQIKLEGVDEPIRLNNQQAFHRNCGGCHDEIAKTRETTAPTSKKCVACHKKNAA